MLFRSVLGDECGGKPFTEGPRLVDGNELKETIRSHHDIEQDTVKHFNCVPKVSRMDQREHVAVDLTDHIVFPRIVL